MSVKRAVIIVTVISSSSVDSSCVHGVRHCAAARPSRCGSWESADRAQTVICAGVRVRSSAGAFFYWMEVVLTATPIQRGENLALRPHHLRDALTCVACWRRSTITGKLRVLTSRPTVFSFVLVSVRLHGTPRTVFVFSAPQFFDRRLTSFCAPFLCVSEEGEGCWRGKKVCYPRKL